MISVVPGRAMALARSRHREQAQVHMTLDGSAQVQGQVLEEETWVGLVLISMAQEPLQKVPGRALQYLLML